TLSAGPFCAYGFRGVRPDAGTPGIRGSFDPAIGANAAGTVEHRVARRWGASHLQLSIAQGLFGDGLPAEAVPDLGSGLYRHDAVRHCRQTAVGGAAR